MIKFLPFDTSLFGYRVGKLQLGRCLPDLDRVHNQAKNFDLIYVMGKPGLVKLGGWSPISTRVDLVKNIIKSDFIKDSSLHNEVEISEMIISGELSQTDQKDLRELVFTSGQWSRFKQDLLLGNQEYEKLYSTWWETIKEQNHSVIVARISGKLVGFITFKLLRGRGHVDLFAVKGSEQGRGIGRQLMYKVFVKLNSLGFNLIGLSTQKANKRAMEFYKNIGFQPIKETLIAHWRPGLKPQNIN
ncbi:GNAT family N-acetyltransferase [Cyclobacterium amurskyense]|uniref:GCN5-related N-acetyltransferase n=1 Tax=Cyclobacterium amurskyense TaxID=320787 RepID=A0A0H4PEX3_9BACT|nr:GNAT family N-acetyltransferase [Cyclobacterium amurskyense]AKP53006.1 GCN5-related N-acetyltransferase [Cyclobacterium amurskyense]|tara:strand:+ start:3603 stop:4334 length:732 start_codon:yes stop_codon:yes gene_type:complete